MEQLKNCPFCGKDAAWLDTTAATCGKVKRTYFARCSCGAEINNVSGDSKEKAAWKWNRREPPMDGIKFDLDVLPCPFCGYKAKVFRQATGHHYIVSCLNTACQAVLAYSKTEREAIDRWNKAERTQ